MYPFSHPNDPQEGAPALAGIGPLPASLGKGEPAAWDAGVFRVHNILQCDPTDIEPSIAAGRPTPDPSLAERFASLQAPPVEPDSVAAMQYRLNPEAGQAVYPKRNSIGEPGFRMIKAVMGCRRLMWRGFQAVTGEWTRVSMAFKLKRLCAISVSIIGNRWPQLVE